MGHRWRRYIYMMMAPMTEPHDGVYREVVFGDNGKDVWFKDPLTHMPTGTWDQGYARGRRDHRWRLHSS